MAKANLILPILTEKQKNRFLSKINKASTDECWLWMASRDKNTGYGSVYFKKRQRFSAHRIAYYIHYGVDPGRLLVCHSCDNPICCNPNHLFLGTLADNNADRDRKGRTAKGEKSGAFTHPEKIMRGEKVWCAKLNDEIVRAIKQKLDAGISGNRIAKEVGVSAQVIWEIKHNKIWKHVKSD